MSTPGPPAYAWDWFARQRFLWREARLRLIASDTDASSRYRPVDARSEVVTLLRGDYPSDARVQRIVDDVVGDVVFLGHTNRPFRQIGVHNPPRGMRWWWSALTGEDVDAVPNPTPVRTASQLSLDDLAEQDPQSAMDEVHEGYGG